MKRNTLLLILLSATVIILFIVGVLSGSVPISLHDIFVWLRGESGSVATGEFIVHFRVPRTITAILCGFALSICGLQMQTLLKNPLADPYILGVSSGAGLGVALFVMGLSIPGLVMATSLFSSVGIVASAWIGSLLVTSLILLVSKRLKDNLSLLIFGIMIGSIAGALISLLQYYSNASALKNYMLWSMGSFSGLTYPQIGVLTGAIFIGTIISIYNIKDLNALLLGESYIKGLGISTNRIRTKVLMSVTLLAGGVTAFCGPIGFVGIAAPHIARMIFKEANHRLLLPAAGLTGTIMMQMADIISQLPVSGGVMPINSVSALLGIPVIIYIIMRKKEV